MHPARGTEQRREARLSDQADAVAGQSAGHGRADEPGRAARALALPDEGEDATARGRRGEIRLDEPFGQDDHVRPSRLGRLHEVLDLAKAGQWIPGRWWIESDAREPHRTAGQAVEAREVDERSVGLDGGAGRHVGEPGFDVAAAVPPLGRGQRQRRPGGPRQQDHARQARCPRRREPPRSGAGQRRDGHARVGRQPEARRQHEAVLGSPDGEDEATERAERGRERKQPLDRWRWRRRLRNRGRRRMNVELPTGACCPTRPPPARERTGERQRDAGPGERHDRPRPERVRLLRQHVAQVGGHAVPGPLVRAIVAAGGSGQGAQSCDETGRVEQGPTGSGVSADEHAARPEHVARPAVSARTARPHDHQREGSGQDVRGVRLILGRDRRRREEREPDGGGAAVAPRLGARCDEELFDGQRAPHQGQAVQVGGAAVVREAQVGRREGLGPAAGRATRQACGDAPERCQCDDRGGHGHQPADQRAGRHHRRRQDGGAQIREAPRRRAGGRRHQHGQAQQPEEQRVQERVAEGVPGAQVLADAGEDVARRDAVVLPGER